VTDKMRELVVLYLDSGGDVALLPKELLVVLWRVSRRSEEVYAEALQRIADVHIYQLQDCPGWAKEVLHAAAAKARHDE
jgi:hypothetical protein